MGHFKTRVTLVETKLFIFQKKNFCRKKNKNLAFFKSRSQSQTTCSLSSDFNGTKSMEAPTRFPTRKRTRPSQSALRRQRRDATTNAVYSFLIAKHRHTAPPPPPPPPARGRGGGEIAQKRNKNPVKKEFKKKKGFN